MRRTAEEVVLWALLLAFASLIARLVLAIPMVRSKVDVAESHHLRALDGLRGLLALSVFAHHAFHTRILSRTGAWDPIDSAFGQFAGLGSVSTFFMITGFLFWSRVALGARPLAFAAFYEARLRRLYPAFALSIVALLVVVACLSHFRQREPLATIARESADMFLLGFRNREVIDGVPRALLINADVTWSLAFETAFYALLPIVSLVRNRRMRLAAIVCGVFLLACWFDAWVALCFLPGIIAAELLRVPQARAFLGTNAKRIAVASCLVLAATLAFFPSLVLSYQELPTGIPLLQIVATAAFFVAVVSFGEGTFLARPEFVLLGAISYGVYLFHGIVLFVVTHLIATIAPTALASNAIFWCAVFALCVPLALLVSLVSFLTIERPFIKRRYAR
jgi:peptidoglycan/LPS O-acetylase OafA/YrhL